MRGKKGLKTVTINTWLRAITAFFNYLYKNDYIPENPVKALSIVRDRKDMIVTLSTKQLNNILGKPDLKTFTGVRNYTYMLLLLETGVRANELVGVEVSDIKWEESTVLVHNTKGYKQRFVPLSPTMKDALRRYLSIRGSIVDCNALL